MSVGPRSGWTGWEDAGLKIDAAALSETLDGGQAFRWRRDESGEWRGVWENHVMRLRVGCRGTIEWSSLAGVDVTQERAEIQNYLGTDEALARKLDVLPWRSDRHLADAIEAYRGLRILRQPLGETLLGFLCSATKQIVQIKQMVELLAVNLGREVAPGIHCLPTWAELAGVDEKVLRRCLLGFRARFVAGTAAFLAERPGWLAETAGLPYATAKLRLMELPGVGEKVADCVLLFGAGKTEAFPVDVWIMRALARRYELTGWKTEQLAQFGRAHFGPEAGLAQQYLFAYERRLAREAGSGR